MRRLMSRALQTAILYKDFTSTEKLLQYSAKCKIVMHVFPVNIEFLVDQKQYNIISLLIFYQTLLRTLISEKRPMLEQMVTRVWEKVKEANVRTIMTTKKMTKEQSTKYLET